MDQRVTTRPVITQDMYNLFDEYIHSSAMPRRTFMRRLAKLAGSSTAAALIAPMFDCNYALADTIKADDPRLDAQWITYKGASGDVKAYLVKPKNVTKAGTVVVTHENRGLNPHIQDVTRRVAVEGYVALGVDYMSQLGGTPPTEEEAMPLFGKMDPAKAVGDGVAAVSFLKTHPNSNGKIGAVGFCWGGGMVNQIAVNSPELTCGVAYYGVQPKAEDAKKVKAKMMLHYAALDERITAGGPAWVEALKANGVDVQSFVYPNAQHAFNNDTSAERYNPEAAKLAWERTLDFFKKNLA
jgi:carboxymethylenebutenolidase